MKLRNDTVTWKLIIAVVVLMLLLIACTVLLTPMIRRYSDPAQMEQLKRWLSSLGVLGYLVMVTIQMAQIVIAFIPGEPVEVLAGVLYGGFGGLLVCLIGCVIASSGIFLLSKRFGAPFVERFFTQKKLEEYSFLRDSRKLEMTVFILFLIPGTPKDMLTYVAGTSPMRLFRFLVISTFARIPSIVSSTFIGASLLGNQWPVALAIFAVTAVIGILGIVYRDRMIEFTKRQYYRRKKLPDADTKTAED